VREEVEMMQECLLVYFRGRPFLVRRRQAAKNFHKYLKGKLPGHRIIGAGSVVECADIEFLIRGEVERISKKGRRMGKAIIERG